MVTATVQHSARVCPRCSQQISGWITNENGFQSCVMCGYIVRDPGYVSCDFKGLFAKYQRVIPSDEPIEWQTDKKVLFDHAGLSYVVFVMQKCCNRHAGERIEACESCRRRYDQLALKLYRGEIVRGQDMFEIIRFVNNISKS